MSMRHNILKFLNNKGFESLDDIKEGIGEKDRKRVQDNVNAAATDKLVERSKDDVTKLPVYKITEAGRKRLEEGILSKGGENAVKRAAVSSADIAPARAISDKDLAELNLWRSVAKNSSCGSPLELEVLLDSLGLDAHVNSPGSSRPSAFACVVDGDAYSTEIEARDAAVTLAKIHHIPVHVVGVIDTARVEMVPQIQWERGHAN